MPDGFVHRQRTTRDALAGRNNDGPLIARLGGAPVTLDQRPLPAAVEQRMPGDQPVALEDLDLVGHAVHLDEAPARSIGNRVIVAADTDHAFAADPAIELEHRAERDQRQEQQRRLFLGERLVDDTAGGGMHARVGDITEPVLELAVEIVEIAEAAAEDRRQPRPQSGHPRPRTTSSPAPPNIPAPRPARFPFSASSAFASSISWTSVVSSWVRSATNSAADLSGRPSPVPAIMGCALPLVPGR